MKFLSFINKYKQVISVGLLAIAFVFFNWIFFSNQNEILKKKLEVAEHNIQAASDSVRVTLDRANKLEANKFAYLTDKLENLGKMNQDLAKEVSQIKGKVSTVIQGEVKIVEKPVPFVVNAQLIDSTLSAHFRYDTTYSPGNYRKLAGFIHYNLKDGTAKAEKTLDEQGIKFLTGIKNLDQGKPEIFLKSDFPGFQVTDLQGAVLDPKLFQPKKKTPLITPGVTFGWTPLLVDTKSQVRLVPGNFGVTAGLSFNIFKLVGIKK